MDPKWVHSIFVVSMYELDQITKMQIERVRVRLQFFFFFNLSSAKNILHKARKGHNIQKHWPGRRYSYANYSAPLLGIKKRI